MRRLGWIVVVSLLAALFAAPAAYAQKRVALVIGNSAYRYTSALDNPKNDAADMAATLRKHGFAVIEGVDLDKAAFDRKVGDFASALKGADAGVFFYAGHGLQVGGQNYLVPIDAKAEEEVRLDLEMVRVDVVHRIMERQTETNVLFLDACRDNPLARNLARSIGTRSAEVGRGLARVDAGVGTLISFATQPGNVALDGAGRNSPYTGALVRHLTAPKEDLSAILIDVRNDVMRETKNKQVPWEHVALRARFYFGSAIASAAPPTPPTRLSEAAEGWTIAERANTIAALDAFVRRFGDTYYGDLAKVQLAELKEVEAAKQKAEEAARSKANAEWERLTLQLQGEEKRKEVETAKRMEDAKARVKASTVRQPSDDAAFPRARQQRPDAVAVIIGNNTYRNGVPNVDYALRDAEAMKLLMTKTLGLDPSHVIVLKDASRIDMDTWFGNDKDHKGKLWRMIGEGQSDLYVFYSGHGVPGGKDNNGAFLLPVDADPNHAGLTAYPLEQLLDNLAKLPAKSTTVFVDGSFSGRSPDALETPLITQASRVIALSKVTVGNRKKVNLFAAAESTQLASWDVEKGHGIFTRYVLSGLAGEADENKDSQVTAGELEDYLRKQVRRAARRAHGREQDPQFTGTNRGAVLSSF